MRSKYLYIGEEEKRNMISIAYIIAGIGLLHATITDMRTREVPDWLSYSLICMGLGIGVISSIGASSFYPALSSLAGLVLGVIIGFVMFYAGQWGGGDSKLIMGLGALIGLPVFQGISWLQLPDFIIFLLNTIGVGALYGLSWAVIMIARHWKAFRKNLTERLHHKDIIKFRVILIIIVVVLIVSALVVQSTPIQLLLAFIALSLFFLFYIWHVSKAIEETCMIKTIPVSKLTEGDWIAEEVKHKGKVLASPADLGITLEQIAKLKQFKIAKVVIKEGIPFVPSFLVAYLLLLILGNWLRFLI